jgi:hypothetical protein
MKDYSDYSIKELKNKIKSANRSKPVFTALASLSLIGGIICSVLGVPAPFVAVAFSITILGTGAAYACDHVQTKSQEALDKTSIENLPVDDIKIEPQENTIVNVKEDSSKLEEQNKDL